MDARLAWVRRLGVLSVIATILLMTLGAWVKANGAGLACPDWPSCYGRYLPPFPSSDTGAIYKGHAVPFTEAQVLYEWTHRAVVSLTFVPLLALAIVAGSTARFSTPLRVLPAAALGLYVFQAVIGAITVVTRNPPWATTWHLFNALLLLVTLVVATCHAYLVKQAAPTARRTFQFTPSVHTERGYTYPDGRAPAAELPPAPAGPFPGEVGDEEPHG